MLMILGMLAGCAGMSLDDYQETTPVFRIEDYFAGKSRGWGVVYSRGGKVTREFTVDLEGGVEGAGTSEEQFVLKERFMFADGERSEREWRVKKVGESGYEGRAHDVVGFAKGQAKGRALNWSYVLRVPVSGKDRDITFDDWMILQPDGVLFNRATMSKWGFRVGEIVIFFKRA